MALHKKDVLKRFADEFGDDIKAEIEEHWNDEDVCVYILCLFMCFFVCNH